MFPFYLTDIAGMQLAQMIHGRRRNAFVAAMLAHVYIGTSGWKRLRCEWTGTVDVTGPSNTTVFGLRRRAPKRRPKPPQGHVAPAE